MNGLNEPRQPDTESCRAYCSATYPDALYYDYVTPEATWVEGRNSCWCKTTNSGRTVSMGVIAGEVKCGSECHDCVSGILGPY